MMICGIDEAGRGEVIGPLVSAGILIKESDVYKLDHIGVKDSKTLTKYERHTLYPKIIDTIHSHHVSYKSAAIVDKHRYYNNLDILEAISFADIIKKLKPDHTIVDSPGNPKTFAERIFGYTNVKVHATHKADKDYSVVSAASIIAKVSYDNVISIINKYHPVGSGATSDQKTRDFLHKAISQGDRLPFIRYSWSTIKDIKRSLDRSQLSLDSFN